MKEKNLSFFERYLSLWVLLCIAGGILIGKGGNRGRSTFYSTLISYPLLNLHTFNQKMLKNLPSVSTAMLFRWTTEAIRTQPFK